MGLFHAITHTPTYVSLNEKLYLRDKSNPSSMPQTDNTHEMLREGQPLNLQSKSMEITPGR